LATSTLSKENLVADCIAIETYREMVRYFGEKDPTTRMMLERILSQEEDHANDMHDLLVRHEGRPITSATAMIGQTRCMP
jgi:bacterioferritin